MPDLNEQNINSIKQLIRDFAEARDWDQFHSPKKFNNGTFC